MSATAPSPAGFTPIEPLPPAMWTRTRGVFESPVFRRWIVLSIALHVLVIVLFGAPTGGSREGRAMFGKISVVIKEGWRDTGPDLRMERELAPRPAEPLVRPPQREVRRPPPPPVDLGITKEVAPSPAVPPVEAPVPVPPLLDRLAPSEPKLELAPAPPVPIERVMAPRVERPLMEAPVAPPEPPALMERMAPAPRIERQMMEAPTPPPIATPAPVAPAPAQAAPARETPAPPPAAANTPETRPADSPTPAPRVAPSPAPDASRLAPPDSPFRRAQPPEPASTFDPTAPPKVDIDMMRKRAGELGRAGSGNRAALPFPMPAVPEKKSKMEDLIDKARKPDCREHYKSLGLAAVVPLIANEFGEGKCKW